MNRFGIVENTLEKQPYLTGNAFTIADAYLFTIARWAGPLKVDLTPFPALQKFEEGVTARPKVYAALKAEHLLRDPAPAAA